MRSEGEGALQYIIKTAEFIVASYISCERFQHQSNPLPSGELNAIAHHSSILKAATILSKSSPSESSHSRAISTQVHVVTVLVAIAFIKSS